jgi:hypothetical protein
MKTAASYIFSMIKSCDLYQSNVDVNRMLTSLLALLSWRLLMCERMTSAWDRSDRGGQLHMVCGWQVPVWIRCAHITLWLPLPSSTIH